MKFVVQVQFEIDTISLQQVVWELTDRLDGIRDYSKSRGVNMVAKIISVVET